MQRWGRVPQVAKAHKPRLSPGDVVAGRYLIDGVVGRGGFGAVYRAIQTDTGVPVALKVLLKNFSTAQKDFKRFIREAALVQRLQHPNVVALLDYGQTDKGQPYIAFELLQGIALRSVLKERGAVPLDGVVRVTRDVLSALETAHGLGIIHRDVKPANVFICDDGNTKVLDFGIAKAVVGEDAGATQLTEAGQMIGTPQYMAPEQVRGTGVYPATDLYALGLLAAEMITGVRVVKGAALIDVYMQHINNAPLDLPPEVRASPLGPIVERATAKAIEARYKSASEMLADLERAFPSAPAARGGSTEALPIPHGHAALAPVQDPLMATYDMREDTVDDDPVKADAATLVMPLPGMEAELRRVIGALEPVGSPPSKLGNTVAMPPNAASLGAAIRAVAASSSPPSGSAYPSGEYAHPSGEYAHRSGEHPLDERRYPSLSGEHMYPSGMHRTSAPTPVPHQASPPAPFDGSGPKGSAPFDDEPRGSGVAWLLIALLLIGLGVGVYLWAPWEHDAERRAAGASTLC